MLRQITSFTNDLEKSGISINFHEKFEDDFKIKIDKTLFSLIMHNFLSNALKYSIPNGTIYFNYSNEESLLDISMYSIRIEDDEIKKIFTDGYRGRNTKDLNENGVGSGLFVVDKSLKLMSMSTLYIDRKKDKTKQFNGIQYMENHFRFNFTIKTNY